jgi:hypothetical protein
MVEGWQREQSRIAVSAACRPSEGGKPWQLPHWIWVFVLHIGVG